MEVIFEHKELNDVKDRAVWISLGEDYFQAERIVNTRAQRWDHAWDASGTAGRPTWMEKNECEGNIKTDFALLSLLLYSLHMSV